MSARTTARHKRIVCSCGAVIAQCRCPGPHETETWANACAACKARPRPSLRVSMAAAVIYKLAGVGE